MTGAAFGVYCKWNEDFGNEWYDMSHILKWFLVDVLKVTLRRKGEPEKFCKKLRQFSRDEEYI